MFWTGEGEVAVDTASVAVVGLLNCCCCGGRGRERG